MKLSEIIDVYKMLEEIANNGKKISDFGIHDKNGEVFAIIGDNVYIFTIDKEEKIK